MWEPNSPMGQYVSKSTGWERAWQRLCDLGPAPAPPTLTEGCEWGVSPNRSSGLAGFCTKSLAINRSIQQRAKPVFFIISIGIRPAPAHLSKNLAEVEELKNCRRRFRKIKRAGPDAHTVFVFVRARLSFHTEGNLSAGFGKIRFSGRRSLRLLRRALL